VCSSDLTSFILIPIITKYLSATDYGIYILINMTGLLAGTVFYFGITSALPRSYFDYSDEKNRNSILSTALYLILIGASLQILLGYLLSPSISQYFFNTIHYTEMLQVMIFACAIGFVNNFFQSYFRLLNKSITVVTQGLLASFLNFITAIALFKFTSLSIYVPILSYLLSQSVICIYSLWLSKNNIELSFHKKEALLMIKFGVPTVLVSFTMMAFEWSDRFFLNKYLTLAEVGIYSFAYKFGTLINPILIAPFAQIWNPLMMKYKDSEDILPLTTKIFTLYFAIGSLFCLITCSYLDELIFVFVKNNDYHKAVYLIPIIMASIFIYGSNNISNAGFLYKRKIAEISNICIVFALLSVLASFLLIPKLGYLGAALSTFIIYLSLSIALLFRSLTYFKFNLEFSKILFFIFFNFFIIFLNYYLNIDSVLIRITLKTIFVILSAAITLYLLLGNETFKILKNPKLILNFITMKESL
jgi:O-antigen/teichoic acid export membrane protein